MTAERYRVGNRLTLLETGWKGTVTDVWHLADGILLEVEWDDAELGWGEVSPGEFRLDA